MLPSGPVWPRWKRCRPSPSVPRPKCSQACDHLFCAGCGDVMGVPCCLATSPRDSSQHFRKGIPALTVEEEKHVFPVSNMEQCMKKCSDMFEKTHRVRRKDKIFDFTSFVPGCSPLNKKVHFKKGSYIHRKQSKIVSKLGEHDIWI